MTIYETEYRRVVRDGERVIKTDLPGALKKTDFAREAYTHRMVWKAFVDEGHGDRVPRLVEAECDDNKLVREFVDGVPLDKLTGPERGAGIVAALETLGVLHGLGIILGDCHAGQFVVRPDGAAVLIDCETCEEDERFGTPAWAEVCEKERGSLTIDLKGCPSECG